jgi:integrase
LPAFGGRPLGELSVDAIREFVAALADEVEAGVPAAKTVDNALGTLVVCLNSAVEDGVLAVNPALRVQRLPPAHIEREYLRLDEIPRYLDACSDVYRPLAELLVGSGLRISEALALRIGDLSSVLRDQVAHSAEVAAGDRALAPVFTMPIRTVKRSQGRWRSAGISRPLDRNTVSRDWHKDALQDAALRDMPLHALRYTARGVARRRKLAHVRAASARPRGHRHD